MAYRSDGATPRQRFDEKVGPPDENGCRLWLGVSTRSDEKAYGLFYADGQMRPAHRWALEQHLGKLPANVDACHRCDVRLCVELTHLFAGTRKQNMEDAVRKGRTSHVPRSQGEAHPMAVLDEKRVSEIRSRHSAGEAMRALSTEFGVSFQSISRIVRHKSWSHIA